MRHTVFLCPCYLTCPWILSNNLINNVQINGNATDYGNSNNIPFPEAWKAFMCIKRYGNLKGWRRSFQHPWKKQPTSNVTLGHFPREISRFTRFLISRGVDVFVTVKDTRFRQSPLIKGGLEIPVEATVRIKASTKNVEAIERFKQLVEQQYKEPVSGQYMRIVQKKCYLEWRRKAVVMKRTRTLLQNSSKWLL